MGSFCLSAVDRFWKPDPADHAGNPAIRLGGTLPQGGGGPQERNQRAAWRRPACSNAGTRGLSAAHGQVAAGNISRLRRPNRGDRFRRCNPHTCAARACVEQPLEAIAGSFGCCIDSPEPSLLIRTLPRLTLEERSGHRSASAVSAAPISVGVPAVS
jgi:hypothetical protein